MEKDIYCLIGSKFRYYRKKKKYTQEKLAELLDITPNHLHKIENGKVHMSLPLLLKAKEILEITANELLEIEQNNYTANIIYEEVDEILKHSNSIQAEIIIRTIKDLYTTLKILQI